MARNLWTLLDTTDDEPAAWAMLVPGGLVLMAETGVVFMPSSVQTGPGRGALSDWLEEHKK
jgi:hypothetical protein